MITFTRDWRGYAKGSSVGTLEATMEALAVAEGAAVYGGVAGPLNSYLGRTNAVQALVDGGGNRALAAPGGLRTVLIGDSETEVYETVCGAVSASFAAATGVLTVVFNGHQQGTGWYIRIANLTYPSFLLKRRLPVTVVDANTFTVQLEPNLAGLPNGTLAGTTTYTAESWAGAQSPFRWLQIASNYMFDVVYNGGVSGNTSQEVLDRIDRDCLSYLPDVVLCHIPGINDSFVISEEQTWLNQKSLVDRISATGALLVLLNLMPTYTGHGDTTVQNMAKVIRLNNRLRQYLYAKRNVALFDTYRQIVDPTSLTGIALPAMLKTDNIHYSRRGGKKVGFALWNQIKGLFGSDTSSLPSSPLDCYLLSAATLTGVSRLNGVITATCAAHGFLTGDTAKATGGSSEFLNVWTTVTKLTANTLSFPSPGPDGAITGGTILLGRNNNLFSAPLLTTATGGTPIAPASGVCANKIRVSVSGGAPTAVCSVVANPQGFGNNQRVVFTADAARGLFINPDYSEYNTYLPTVVKPGRSYYAEAFVSFTNVAGSNLGVVQLNCTITLDGVTYQTYSLNGYETGSDIIDDWSGMLRTPPLLLPPGTAVTSVNIGFSATASAAGTAVTIEIGRMALREIEGA